MQQGSHEVHRKKIKALFGALLLGMPVASVGCGGIADVSSGLPADKLGQDLTIPELEQLCQAIEAYAERHPLDPTAACRGLGLSSVSDLESSVEDAKLVCQDRYDACTSEGGPIWTFCDGLIPEDYSLGACTSTVKEIEDCLSIDIVRSSEIGNALRYCDEIDIEYVLEFHYVLARELRTPAGCESVRQNCPRAL